MNLKPRDQIPVTITQVSSKGITGDASSYANVRKILVNARVAKTVLSPGKEIVAEVTTIDSNVATVEQVRATYARQHWAGDTVEVTAKKFLRKGVCKAELASPKNLDYVLISGMVPEETAKVKLSKVRNRIGFGKVEERLSPGIQVGEEVLADIQKKGWEATARNGSFTVNLDTYAPVKDSVKVEITSIDNRVDGNIVWPATYPIPGAEAKGTITQGKKAGELREYGTSVTLDKPAKVTGPVPLQIETVAESGIHARATDYRNTIPEEDDTVTAEVSARTDTATATINQLELDIGLDYPAPLNGTALIKIEHSDRTEYSGTVVKYTDKPIAPGKTLSGQVYTKSNKIITGPRGRSIYLTHNVETPGHAEVEITKIEAKIYGKIVGEVTESTKREFKQETDNFIGSKNDLINSTNL